MDLIKWWSEIPLGLVIVLAVLFGALLIRFAIGKLEGVIFQGLHDIGIQLMDINRDRAVRIIDPPKIYAEQPQQQNSSLHADHDLRLIFKPLMDALTPHDVQCPTCKGTGLIHEPGQLTETLQRLAKQKGDK